MIIERNLAAYLVYAEDPVLRALEKITANQSRIIFLVDSHGHLEGSLSDGDFRRWIATQSPVDLNRPTREAAHFEVSSASVNATPVEIATLFRPGVDHVPLVDERGRLVAVAINRDNEIRIGRYSVDKDSPCLVISEIGINHQGSVDFAKELVDRSVEAGADVVKFQLRDMDALYRQGAGASGGEDLGPQYTLDLLSRFNLRADQLFEVFDHCADAGIEAMCTAWDAPSVDRLVEYGIPAFKVASADMTNHTLLRHMGRYGMPMVISTGMSTEGEICETVELVRGHRRVVRPAALPVDLPGAVQGRQPALPRSGWPRSAAARSATPATSAASTCRSRPSPSAPRSSRSTSPSTASWRATTTRSACCRASSRRWCSASARSRRPSAAPSPRGVSTGEMMNRVNLAKSPGRRPPDRGRRTDRPPTPSTSRAPAAASSPTPYDRLVGRTASPRLRARRLLLRHRPRRRARRTAGSTTSDARGACPCATTTSATMTTRLHARLPGVPLLLQGPRARPRRGLRAVRRPGRSAAGRWATPATAPTCSPATSCSTSPATTTPTGSARSPSCSGSST